MLSFVTNLTPKVYLFHLTFSAMARSARSVGTPLNSVRQFACRTLLVSTLLLGLLTLVATRNPAGAEPLPTVSTFASSSAGLSAPSGIAVGLDNNIYVYDHASSEVLKFSPDGTSSVFATGLITGDGTATLGFDSSGTLYFLGTNGIQKISPDGHVGPILTGGSDGCWNVRNGQGITFTPDGTVYVVERTCTNRLVRLNQDGTITIVNDVGVNSETNGNAAALTSSADGSVLYEATETGYILQISTTTGAITTIAKGLGHLTGIVVGRDGNIYAASVDQASVFEVTPAGEVSTFLREAQGLTGVAVDAVGDVYVTNVNEGKVLEGALGIPLVPSAPVNPVVLGEGNGQAVISWGASASNIPLTGYMVTATPGGATCQTTLTSCRISGLTDGSTYTFEVSAMNATGNSLISSSSPLTTGGQPSVPTGVTAYPGSGQLTINWQPSTPGNSSVDGYVAVANPGGGTCSATVLSRCVIYGLTHGGTYSVTVRALSATGNSLPSSPLSAPPVLSPNVVSVMMNPGILNPTRAVFGLDGSLYVGDNSPVNGIYKLANGARSLFVALPARPTGIASDPSGDIFSDDGQGNLLKTTPGGVVSTYSRSIGASWNDWTVAADGSIYGVNQNSGARIYRFNPVGAPDLVAAPSNIPGIATGITLDTAGNYFLATDQGGIYRVSSGNEVTTIALGLPRLGGIAVGPNGDLYTAGGTNIYQVSLDGHVDVYASVSNGLLYGPSFDSAGNLFVVHQNPTEILEVPNPTPTLPTAPQSVKSTGVDSSSATVTWNPSTSTNAPILGYTVSAIPAGPTCSSTTTSCTITGLDPTKSYSFSVVGTDFLGDSQPSVPSPSVTPGLVPSAPMGVHATAGTGAATVVWSEPVSNPDNVTGYTVTSHPSGLTCSTTSKNFCTVKGLALGEGVTFTVAATSNYGTSFPSAPSDAVIPQTLANLPFTQKDTQITQSGQRLDGCAMVVGPDGNFYIASGWDGNVWKVTPSGQATLYARGVGCPNQLASAPDGTLYAAGGNQILSISTMGEVKSIESGYYPEGVTVGPDGYLYFSNNNSVDQIDRISPNGGPWTAAFTFPNQGSLRKLTFDGNGNLFVQQDNGILELSPSGTHLQIIPNQGTQGLALSPNGDVYTISNNALWQINGAGVASTVTPINDYVYDLGFQVSGDLVMLTSNNLNLSFLTGMAPIPSTSPSGVSVASPGSGQVTISWNASTALGVPVTGYTVTASPGGATCTSTTTSCTIAGLSNGTTYTFTVVASDIVGDSDPSTASSSLTVGRTPSVPVITGTQFGQHQVTVNWTRSTVVGSGTVNYVVQAMTTDSPSQLAGTCSTTTLSCSVSGLTDGVPYTFSAVAFNASGSSTRSESTSPVVPMAAPESPTAVTALVAATGAVKVSWQLGDSNGSPLRSVVVTASPGGATCSPSDPAQSWCVVSGLTNGSLYSFSVVATNAVGSSLPSAPSNISIPMVVNKTLFPSMAPGSNLFSFNPGARSAMLGGYFWVIDNVGQLEQFSSTGSYLQSFDLGDPLNELSSDGLNLYLLPWVPNPQGVLTLFTIPVVAPVPSSGPAAPTLTSLVPGKSSLTAHWTPPSSLAGSIVGYTLTIRQGSKIAGSCSTKWSTSGCKIGNLQDLVNYSATVVAFEKTGKFTTVSSNESAPLFAIPVSPIGAPKPIFVSSPVKGSATLRWSAASSPDRENVTYLVLVTKADGTAVASRSLSGTTTSVSNLVTGVRYTATITASTPATTSGLTPSTSSSISFVER